jgi:KamA family protein
MLPQPLARYSNKHMEGIRRITRLEQASGLDEQELADLKPVENKFVFRSNSYYDSLINWEDPDDPIRRLVIPDKRELEEWGELDASEEHTYTRVPGLQHKYPDTALLLINDVCSAYCRFCFRKRLFLDENNEVVRDVSLGMEYIAGHREITNVLLTGGDPLVMPTRKLQPVIEQLRSISHVKIIRIGTKMPAFEPQRLTGDQSFLDMIRAHSTGDNKIYIMAHFTHPRELTPESLACIDALQHAGAIAVNQTPMIAGINDSPVVLAELLNRLSFAGVPPYYVFQCRPTLGNRSYSVPLETAWETFSRAQARCSGLARRARFVISHSTGKVEVMMVSDGLVYMKYLRAAAPSNDGRFMIFQSDKNAHWLDDYVNCADGSGAA